MTSCVLCLCLSAGLGQNPGEVLLPPPAYEVVPISIGDFAHAFKPQAGRYEVVFLHPVKCCPVKVCFDLPCGCPIVRCGKRSIDFDYGKCRVSIHFKLLCGKVSVVYT